MDAQAENKNKYFALGFTLLFHAILFLIFILVVFVTPIPPFEVKPVIELEMGIEMMGQGNTDAGGSSSKQDKEIATQPETPQPVAKSEPVATKTVDQPTPSQEKVVMDETGETVNITKASPKKKAKKDKKDKVKEIVTPQPVEQKPSSELTDLLARYKSQKAHTGEGHGGGGPDVGIGKGKGPGLGDGPGDGHGDGPPGGNGNGYDLKGRKIVQRPTPMTDPEDEGRVVVEIIVDETGRVIKATPGQRGSTTTSANLYSKARQAAMQARFNASPNGIKEQRGTYTFVFTLE